MTVTIKDAIYLALFVVSIITLVQSNKNKIANLYATIDRLEKIIFKAAGVLNLVDCQTCEKHRDHVYSTIRKGELVTEMMVKKIEELNNNVLLIKTYLELKEQKKLDQKN